MQGDNGAVQREQCIPYAYAPKRCRETAQNMSKRLQASFGEPKRSPKSERDRIEDVFDESGDMRLAKSSGGKVSFAPFLVKGFCIKNGSVQQKNLIVNLSILERFSDVTEFHAICTTQIRNRPPNLQNSEVCARGESESVNGLS